MQRPLPGATLHVMPRTWHLPRIRDRLGHAVALALLIAIGAAAAACSSPPAGAHRLEVQVRRVTLYDVPLDIKVSGTAAGLRVTAVLVAVGSPRWSSRAVFIARGPVLDLRTAAPVSGSYRGVDAMGLFESLAASQPGQFFAPAARTMFRLTLSAPGHGMTAITLTRELAGPGVHCSAASRAQAGFAGLYCAAPVDRDQGPAVLVFGGSEGGLSTIWQAELLASRGFPALALAYFGEPGLPQALDRIPLEYFARAARWISGAPGVASLAGARRIGQRVVVWGISRGSEAALLLGADFPTLIAGVIAGSPSSVTNPAVSLARRTPPGLPAWTLHGRPLPVADPLGDPASTANPAAVIPVERIRGPVLLLVGADDRLWPSPRYAQAIISRLRRSHDRFPYQDAVFPGAGHEAGAALPYDVEATSYPSAIGTLDLGGTPFVNSAASAQAWQDVLAFLQRLG
jgi:dienelactone hydrolase